jgi:hypothetical protein
MINPPSVDVRNRVDQQRVLGVEQGPLGRLVGGHGGEVLRDLREPRVQVGLLSVQGRDHSRNLALGLTLATVEVSLGHGLGAVLRPLRGNRNEGQDQHFAVCRHGHRAVSEQLFRGEFALQTVGGRLRDRG